MPAKPDFRAVFRFLNASGIRYVIVGGVAAGVVGEPRATIDVDLVTFLPQEELDLFLGFLRKRRTRFSEREIRKHVRGNAFFRMTVAGTQVDFIVGESAFEFDVLTRAVKVWMFGVRIPVASPEDVLLMKLVSGRTIDWLDAKAIQVRQGTKLDGSYLKSWAARLRVQRGRGRVSSRLKKLYRMRYRE